MQAKRQIKYTKQIYHKQLQFENNNQKWLNKVYKHAYK